MMCGVPDSPRGRHALVAATPSLKVAAMSPTSDTSRRLAFRVDEAADALRISRSSLYILMKTRQLPFAVIAGRRVIRVVDVEAFLETSRAA